jgi:hypothetical protein
MQRQQKLAPRRNESHPQMRWVSISKFLVSFFILIWGFITLCALIPILKTGENHYIEEYITAFAMILQSIFSFFGGIFSLLRHRKIARFCLYSVSFSLVVLGISMALIERHAGNPAQIPLMLGISLAIFIVGVTSFFLARWLTSQDDE